MADTAPLRAASADLPSKVAQLAERMESLRAAAHEAHLREALTRTELSLALAEALAGRAAAVADMRARTASRYFRAPDVAGLPRAEKQRQREPRLTRFGAFGQALIIEGRGVWTGTGQRLYDLRHMAAYARRGANPQLQPPTSLNQAWYLEQNPDVGASGVSPLVHYLLTGATENRSPNPMLDLDWYARQNAADMADYGLTVLEHFVRIGAPRGDAPQPLFDMVHYAGHGPELSPGEDLASHYHRVGWREGLSPHPLFDPAWYAAQLPEAERNMPPLLHYVSGGWRAGRSPHPLFDPAWYLEANPDVAAGGHEPLTHFVLSGAAEGRSPGPWFDLPHYVAARASALAAGRNPLVDYLEGGAWAVAEPRPGFPTWAYLTRNPELAREAITPLEHLARRNAG